MILVTINVETIYCNCSPEPEEDEDLLRDDVWRQDAEEIAVVFTAGRSVVVEHAPRQAGKHLDDKSVNPTTCYFVFLSIIRHCTVLTL